MNNNNNQINLSPLKCAALFHFLFVVGIYGAMFAINEYFLVYGSPSLVSTLFDWIGLIFVAIGLNNFSTSNGSQDKIRNAGRHFQYARIAFILCAILNILVCIYNLLIVVAMGSTFVIFFIITAGQLEGIFYYSMIAGAILNLGLFISSIRITLLCKSYSERLSGEGMYLVQGYQATSSGVSVLITPPSAYKQDVNAIPTATDVHIVAPATDTPAEEVRGEGNA